ncbi:GNAT family N-acetyltransferase [Streptomyces qinzhouensis]|uniref:GNAT family N-acetyltransferase n=1 Tax=Streptomyces qinzhouensis TaxID=2599401 RepID=A0A5B8J788_9ACTN|nr:GNAT family N-acetyltransferase [Streptomyces qinzhouensis]QDY77086.1 GNAT family N-acetyltransferase [Streptomyces qinzhouensis]
MSLVDTPGAYAATIAHGVRVQLRTPAELGERELNGWRALRRDMVAAGAPASPFMEPEFTLAVGRVRPEVRVAVLWRDGEAVGFLPFERAAFGRGRAVGLGVSDCQGAVLAPGLGLITRELLAACGLSVFEFDNLEDGQELFVPAAAESFRSPVIDVSRGYAAYEDLLRIRAPKLLKTTLAKERRLARQAGEIRFVFDERDPAALATLMEWKSAQYRRTGRGDRFAKEWIAELVRRLHGSGEAGCAGVLSVLYAGGRPVAAHFGLRSRTLLACWFPSYDPAFAKYSPGLVLHLRMAEGAAAAGIGTLDLGRGDAEYKESLHTGEFRVHEGAVVRAGPGAAVHWLLREPARRAHGFVRDRPELAARGRRALSGLAKLRTR